MRTNWTKHCIASMSKKKKKKIMKLYDANVFFQAFLSECLRVCMTNMNIDVQKAEKRKDEGSLNGLYQTAVDTSVIFRSLLSANSVDTQLLIQTLQNIQKFSKEVSMLRTSEALQKDGIIISDEVQFEFYKISLNATRAIAILKNNYDPYRNEPKISESSLFIRSINAQIDAIKKEGGYLIEVDGLEFEPDADKVHVKYIIGKNLFETLFKVLMSGVVKNILTTNFSLKMNTSLVESSKCLSTLYNMRLIYKKDNAKEIIRMLEYVLRHFKMLEDVLDENDTNYVFSPEEIGNFSICKKQCKTLIRIFKRVTDDNAEYLNMDKSLAALLKEQYG